MVRWHGYKPAEVRAMLLTDFWMLDGFLARHPPLDISIAAYLGVHSQRKGRMTPKEAARVNAKALAQLPARRNAQPLPARLRTPEHLALLEKMKAEWQTT
jgi:hypothetical protein